MTEVTAGGDQQAAAVNGTMTLGGLAESAAKGDSGQRMMNFVRSASRSLEQMHPEDRVRALRSLMALFGE